MKMLEILHSINFKNLLSANRVPEMFEGFDADNFIRIDERGCQLHDIKEIYRHIRRKIRLEQEKGTSAAPMNLEDINNRIRLLLDALVTRNFLKSQLYANFSVLEAWKEIVIVSLTKSFSVVQ